MTAHASCCILNTFWPIITKNVLLSTYFTTDLYHRMTHTATSPHAPVVVISKVIVSFLKDNWSTGGVFLLSLWCRQVTAPSFNEVTQKHGELTPSWALFLPKCQQDAELAQEEQVEGGEPSPCSSAQHWWGHTWSSQYKPGCAGMGPQRGWTGEEAEGAGTGVLVKEKAQGASGQCA